MYPTAFIALVALCLLVGIEGRWSSRHQVDEAIAFFDPSERLKLRELGYREASRPAQLAGLSGGPAMLMGLLSCWPSSTGADFFYSGRLKRQPTFA